MLESSVVADREIFSLQTGVLPPSELPSSGTFRFETISEENERFKCSVGYFGSRSGDRQAKNLISAPNITGDFVCFLGDIYFSFAC